VTAIGAMVLEESITRPGENEELERNCAAVAEKDRKWEYRKTSAPEPHLVYGLERHRCQIAYFVPRSRSGMGVGVFLGIV
jgi:hypothetical protein